MDVLELARFKQAIWTMSRCLVATANRTRFDIVANIFTHLWPGIVLSD